MEMFVTNCGTLGEKARLARLALHLRQIDVASKTGVNTSDVINLEKGRMRILPQYKIDAILKLLGIGDDSESKAERH